MGCFASKSPRRSSQLLPVLTHFPLSEYPWKATLCLSTAAACAVLTLSLPEPLAVSAELLPLPGTELRLSCTFHIDCVLPGIDPLGDLKTCQDLVFYEIQGETLLMGLMDGHGVWGNRVVQYCKSVCLAYFQAEFSTIASDPAEFLRALCSECQSKLVSGGSRVNCSLSGTTAIFALLQKGEIHLASLGDSRAVLGTSVVPVPAVAVESQHSFNADLLSRIRAIRDVIRSDVKAAPLTKDQKPDDSEELPRILASGGEVRKCFTDLGTEAGPQRVWRPNEPYPGLAMARSLGDTIAHTLGVSATPALTRIATRTSIDKFVVLASDGVWDVMESQEVCAFIDQHRSSAASDKPRSPGTVRASEVPVAQLLCEEARTRWLSVIEAEDAVVDDISCIVLELTPKRVCEQPRRPSQLVLTEVVKERRSLLVAAGGRMAAETPETPETALLAFRAERSP